MSPNKPQSKGGLEVEVIVSKEMSYTGTSGRRSAFSFMFSINNSAIIISLPLFHQTTALLLDHL